jgi:hypothetical protein
MAFPSLTLSTGPTSLVVVTRLPLASTHTPQHHPALIRLLHHPMLNASRLSLHMLHLDPMTPEAPNVFLNLARLFAPTRTLLLVPGTPQPPPPSSILSLYMAHVPDPVVVQAVVPGPRTGITADKRRPAALAALSPMLIPRDHPLWCIERLAFVPAPVAPRAADWDACLWQVQLETFGAAATNGPTLLGWRWDVEPQPAEPVLPSVSLTVSNALFLISAVRMGVNRNSLLFAAGWKSGIVSRRVCSRLGGSKCSVRSGTTGATGVWGHALDVSVRRRCVGYMKYAKTGRIASRARRSETSLPNSRVRNNAVHRSCKSVGVTI